MIPARRIARRTRGLRCGASALRSGFNDCRAVAGRGVVAVLIASGMLLVGCSMSRSTPSSGADAGQRTDMGQQATLRAIGGSAVSGKIRVIDRGDGATVLVSVVNFPTATYRLAFHERPNCTSPNGFSAGAAWAPPSSGKRPDELVPTQYASAESQVEAELRIRGLHATGADGVAGRSVVLYAGSKISELRPDVPNAAVACGVFETARPLVF